jgi:hypothetical protein
MRTKRNLETRRQALEQIQLVQEQQLRWVLPGTQPDVRFGAGAENRRHGVRS